MKYNEAFMQWAAKETVKIGKYILPEGAKPEECNVEYPLSWIVLEKKDGKMLLISEQCIDWEFMDGQSTLFEEAYPSSWKISFLRKLLNNEFYSKAFSDEEKNCICETEVIPDENPEYGTSVGEITEDKIFILSVSEIMKYMKTADARRAAIPMFDKIGDKYYFYCNCSNWWTRTPGYDSRHHAIVDSDGTVSFESIHNDADEVGVRAAMWVDMELFLNAPEDTFF